MRTLIRLALAAAAAALSAAGAARAKDYMGVKCTPPPPAHCSGEACATDGSLANLGNAVDAKTGRKFFLDYPCDLKPGEKVIFLLNIHGAGSIGNWQRHYFPAMDYKDKYRLVIATPTAATLRTFPGQSGPGVRMWVPEADDAHLQNITSEVIDAFGPKNIKAFWLVGHSQGGATAHRIVCSDFFKDKVDGLLSLSGGRIGRAEINPRFGPPQADGSPPPPRKLPTAMTTPPPPSCQFSHIFETGEHEIVSLPSTSPLAAEFGCGPRVQKADVVDTRPGYVWDYARAGYPVWGMKARPGTAHVWVYPNCKGGRVVADVERLDKGHTEGLEPRVTEAILKLVAAAPGGKLQRTQTAAR
jgi:pimeloyl-ACP methyl ester carboxylesterase